MIQFQPVSLNDKTLIEGYLKMQKYDGAECSFTNLYMWRTCYHFEWAVINDYLCIKLVGNQTDYLLPPWGKDDSAIKIAVEKLLEYCSQQQTPFLMRNIPENTKQRLDTLFPDRFIFTADRDNSDYIYLTEELINLSGKRFHGKRNHISNFKKSYPDYLYQPLTSDLIQPCLDHLHKWCERKKCQNLLDESIICERDAIIEAFNQFGNLNYNGGVILIDGEVEAFTIGEQINEEMVLIHVEKANTDFKGIYPTINQEYLKHNWAHIKYVNREEDLGNPGLRKAKLSYHPVKMVVKYQAALK